MTETTDGLDDWVEWCRECIRRKPKDKIAHLMLALIFEMRRLRGEL